MDSVTLLEANIAQFDDLRKENTGLGERLVVGTNDSSNCDDDAEKVMV